MVRDRMSCNRKLHSRFQLVPTSMTLSPWTP